MPALMPLLLLLAAQPVPPQKSGDSIKPGTHSFVLEVGNDSAAIEAFQGSAQRIGVTSAASGAANVAKTPTPISTSAVLPLLPGAGVRAILEQAFSGTPAGNWQIREIDFRGQEVFVHQLEGVRLRSLELASFDAQSKEAPKWSTTFDVGTARLSAGSQGTVALKGKSKVPRAGGVRILQEGKELAQVRSIDGLRFDFPDLAGSKANKAIGPAILPDVLRVRLAGNDVQPWINRLGSASAAMEIELLDASEAKPTVAARILFDSAQLVGVARPCGNGANEIELEYRCVGPRLKF
jgi:hypothetical protein